jgi:serine phosphatase RsbU (regulator of sigma subunit)
MMDPGPPKASGKTKAPGKTKASGKTKALGKERALTATVARLRAENAALRLAAAEFRRILDAEQQLAEQLRQIILPLPAAPLMLPGLQVAVRYLPAEHGAPVGGDWYHATALAGGTVILAVGDVAGHGLTVAATMAELRHALAVLTVTTTVDPAELLGYLNQVLCDHDGERPRTATAVVARFDRTTGVLTWAQAGHPAPLLVHGGEVSELRRPHGMLLGANATSGYETATLTLACHDTLMLFTDGLIEPQGGGPDDRLDDVADSLLASVAEGSDCSLTDLLRRFPPANPADDTCILVARVTAR